MDFVNCRPEEGSDDDHDHAIVLYTRPSRTLHALVSGTIMSGQMTRSAAVHRLYSFGPEALRAPT